MGMLEKNPNDSYSANELNNLSKNIRAKAIKLGVTLPKLAEMMGIDYVTLTRIVNYKPDYLPNLKALSIIAKFFEVGIGDLLTNPNIPQYLPILQLNEVALFFSDDKFDLSNKKTLFSNTWIHDKACAIAVPSGYFGKQVEINFLLKPHNSIKIDSHLLITYKKKEFYFLKIAEYTDEFIVGTNLITNEALKLTTTEVSIVAIASKMFFNNSLI